MTLELITEGNLEMAVRVQEELFPGESGRANLEDSVMENTDFAYYLLHEDGACVGISGIYRYPEDPESAWLGWFGIREGYRRWHLGSEALKKFEEMAADRGFRFARLYTDAENNDEAIAFYTANGYFCEPYQNEGDPACRENPTLIFSKPLTTDGLVLWNSRSIHLTEQIMRQQKYTRGPEGAAEPQTPAEGSFPGDLLK